jgi:hypothetical protein
MGTNICCDAFSFDVRARQGSERNPALIVRQ